MQFMVVEKFHQGKTKLIYQRVAERGRMLPTGLQYISSWISADLQTCYQLMETDDADLLEQWSAQWKDLADFDWVEVIDSDTARKRAQE